MAYGALAGLALKAPLLVSDRANAADLADRRSVIGAVLRLVLAAFGNIAHGVETLIIYRSQHRRYDQYDEPAQIPHRYILPVSPRRCQTQ